MINCLCIIQDKVLAYIIKKYISKTPFLTYNEGISMTIETYLDKSRTDLVIAELNKDTEKDIDKLRSTLSEGYFILFNYDNNFKNFEKYQQSHFLDKNFTYADFIETLSLVIDNKTFDRMIN